MHDAQLQLREQLLVQPMSAVARGFFPVPVFGLADFPTLACRNTPGSQERVGVHARPLQRKVHYRIDVREPRTGASPYTCMPVVVSARHGTRSCATAQCARNLPAQWLAQTQLCGGHDLVRHRGTSCRWIFTDIPRAWASFARYQTAVGCLALTPRNLAGSSQNSLLWRLQVLLASSDSRTSALKRAQRLFYSIITTAIETQR